MSEVGQVALALVEALLERLRQEGVLSAEDLDVVLDAALARMQAKSARTPRTSC